jgi:hypothetical protein
MSTRRFLSLATICSSMVLTAFSYLHGEDFYDASVLRKIELEFTQTNWWQLLEANAQSGQNISARLTVEGVSYDSVGVRFRGFTSYSMIGTSKKKSFNIEVDWKKKQDLMGYETINLINCYEDPTFIREALYSNAARNVLPSARVNFVKLTINGENWGIYSNVQQLDGKFTKEWFPSNQGTRWRAGTGQMNGGGGMPGGGGPGGGGVGPGGRIPGGGIPGGGTANTGMNFGASLTYEGLDSTAYAAVYKIVHTEQDNPWQSLIHTCDVLNNTPWAQYTTEVPKVLDVDRALWLCAFEIVFHDDDGYVYKRGGDYYLYYEPESGQIHVMQFDGNTCMKTQQNGQWPVFFMEDDSDVPFMNLLVGGVQEYRERYLAHIRSIIKLHLNEDYLFPRIDAYRGLIESEIKADTKKLYSNSAFDTGINELKTFIQKRKTYLLSDADVARPAPELMSVSADLKSEGTGLRPSIAARIGGAVPVAKVNLFLREGGVGPFSVLPLSDDGLNDDGGASDGIYGIKLPVFPPGTVLRYYVQAIAADEAGTMVFEPECEHLASRIVITTPRANASPVVVNELMAQNNATVEDPQGEYDDWIELKNTTSETVDLSGMYLSDNPENPLKWAFPDGAQIESGGYAIVWADENGQATPGFHANFKLSASGEMVLLFDSDANGDALLDSVTFGPQLTDQSFGRCPDEASDWRSFTKPTPGSANGVDSALHNGAPNASTYSLWQAYPNPFNPQTTISLSIPARQKVVLAIFNAAGREVARLNESILDPGRHDIRWKAEGMPSGVYFCRIVTGSFMKVQKVVLLR